ncbi:MAG: SRPBCC family protein [Bergeyella sp.]|nr:SRPBCC family protein [Bergeyella sp.]
MNLEGRKIIVNKSLAGLKAMLQHPEGYRDIMPEGLRKFEPLRNGFRFSLRGMPEIALNINEVTDKEVVLSSGDSNLDFSLKGEMNPLSETQTEIQLFFKGKFNPFIKMMVEKPLQNFINTLTDNIEKSI